MGCIKCTTLCFRSCVLSFRNELAQSISLGPKLSFWAVSRDSVAGGTVVRSGFGVHTMHHFVLPKLRLVFSQRTCPIHFIRPNYISGWFPSIPLLGGTRCEIGFSGFRVHKMHHFVLPKLRLVFSQRTCPIHFFRPKTKFLGGFARFRCRRYKL